MGLRPAKTCREVKGQSWSRISSKKPRKSYVKGAPSVKVRQFNMGMDRPYELEVKLVAREPVQVRDSAIESARQSANKVLEQNLVANYFFQVTVYPHLVLREHSALGVAGADRISKGMKKAFGRPKGRMAKLLKGTTLLTSRIFFKDLHVLKKAFARATKKLPGFYEIVVKDISKDAANLAKKEHAFKKKEEEKPVVAEAAAAGEAPKTESGAPVAGDKTDKTDKTKPVEAKDAKTADKKK